MLYRSPTFDLPLIRSDLFLAPFPQAEGASSKPARPLYYYFFSPERAPFCSRCLLDSIQRSQAIPGALFVFVMGARIPRKESSTPGIVRLITALQVLHVRFFPATLSSPQNPCGAAACRPPIPPLACWFLSFFFSVRRPPAYITLVTWCPIRAWLFFPFLLT